MKAAIIFATEGYLEAKNCNLAGKVLPLSKKVGRTIPNVVAPTVGVVSGVWIFKPLLEEMEVNRKEREAREALEAAAAASSNGTTTPISQTEGKQ